jgi:hypothetical protein
MLKLAHSQSTNHQLEVFVEGDSLADLSKADEARKIALDVARQAIAAPMIAKQENVIVDAHGRSMDVITDLNQLKTARFFKKIVFTSGGMAR